MKLLKRYWGRSYGWMLSSLMSLLGFSGCDESWYGGQPDPQICMYGTPTASFSIKGKVTDSEGKALPGIRVIVPVREECQRATPGFIPDTPVRVIPVYDTVYTDSDGKFSWRDGCFPTDTVRYELQFSEVPAGGEEMRYEPDTLKVTFLAKDLVLHETGNPWNRGQAEKTVDVILKEKKDE